MEPNIWHDRQSSPFWLSDNWWRLNCQNAYLQYRKLPAHGIILLSEDTKRSTGGWGWGIYEYKMDCNRKCISNDMLLQTTSRHQSLTLQRNRGNAFCTNISWALSPGSSECFGDLGCFSNDAPFFSLQRPISFLPQSPSRINPKFTLYSREAPLTGHLLHSGDAAGLRTSTFQASRPTKFIVHGFIDNTYLGNWMQVGEVVGSKAWRWNY